MKKVFIFWICETCGEPTRMVEPCRLLGYNDFPETNFHGELSIEDTEKLRQHLIDSLIKNDNTEMAFNVKNLTKVIEIEFLNYDTI